MDRTVKYFKLISSGTSIPHSTSRAERSMLMKERGEKWCHECRAVVDPETKLRISDGLIGVCPHCGEEIE